MGTILVKKSDGTQVRMTLDEFKLYKENLKNNPNNNQSVAENKEETKTEVTPSEVEKKEDLQPIAQSVVESPEDDESLFNQSVETPDNVVEQKTVSEELPMLVTDHSLANTTPVKEIFVNEAVYKKSENKEIKKKKERNDEVLLKWSKDDHKSLLEENDEEIKKHHIYTTLPSLNAESVDNILSQLSFSVPEDLRGRLQSLVLSRIKDIRTNEQILECALKTKESGGLGFSSDQAQELVIVIKNNFNDKSSRLKSKEDKIVVEKKVDLENFQPKISQNIKTQPVFNGKKTLHDITPPTLNQNSVLTNDESNQNIKKSVGPIEELSTFDLRDWRRLSNNPAKAGEKLLEKFIILKKDSIILYFDGVEAWRKSPLYNMYKQIIADCVSSRQKIKDYLFNQDKNNTLSSEEFDELVKVNKNLV